MLFSIDPFQRLTAGGTFHRAFFLFAKRLSFFLTVSVIIFIPLAAIMITMMRFMGASMQTLLSSMNTVPSNNSYDNSNYNFNNNNNNNADWSSESSFDQNGWSVSQQQQPSTYNDETTQALLANFNAFGLQFFLEYICLLVVAIAGKAAMAYGVAQLYAGREPNWSEALKQGFRKWCTLFCAGACVGLVLGGYNFVLNIFISLLAYTQSSLAMVLIVLLFLFWMVLLIYIAVSLMILAPVIMVENTGPVQGIKRCWTLAWNHRCYIFCTVFCLAMAYYVVQIILTAILMAVGGQEAIMTGWGGFVLIFPVLFYLPLVVIIETVAYLNIRVEQEGLNRSVLVMDLDGELAATGEVLVNSKYDMVEVHEKESDFV